MQRTPDTKQIIPKMPIVLSNFRIIVSPKLLAKTHNLPSFDRPLNLQNAANGTLISGHCHKWAYKL
jgi:hypothetical protein